MIFQSGNKHISAIDISRSGLRGVNPAKQKRSREMEARLLAAGRLLLERGSIEALSIDEVCATANCAVGAFYSRFESKDAFFGALQYVICRERDFSMARLIEVVEAEDWDLHQTCTTLIEDLVSWYRTNFGILRASLLAVENGENAWSPIRKMGLEHKKIWLKLLAPRMATSIERLDQRKRILFVNQVVNGTLVHMLLINSGPFKLTTKETVTRMSSLVIDGLTPEE